MKPNLLALAYLATAAPIIHAQTAPIPGARIRVTAPTLQLDRAVGTLVFMSADSVILRRESDTIAIAAAALTGFEVSAGYKLAEHIGLGALEGAVGGAAFGFGLAKGIGLIRGNPAPCRSKPDEWFACWDYDIAKDLADPVAEAKAWGVVGLVAGTIAGVVQGITQEHWQSPRPFGVTPIVRLGARSGVGLSIGL